MLVIAHRGNINGKSELYENKPSYIMKTIELGFDVETDLWIIENKFFLGHDNPQYEIDHSFLNNNKLWIHAKNFKAFFWLVNNKDNLKCQYFWHQNDNFTLTSNNLIWTYPDSNLKLSDKSIAVLPELVKEWNLANCYGICTDYCYKYT